MTDPRRKRADGVRTLADLKARCVIGEGGCWLWRCAVSFTRGGTSGPVSRVWLPADPATGRKTTTTTASRAAWLLSGRELEPGGVVWRSTCRAWDCINPDHGAAGPRGAMFAAFVADGRLRGDPKRAVVNARNRAVLCTPREVVQQAEAMFARGEMQKAVIAALGIDCKVASRIRKGLHPHSSARQPVVRGASVFTLGAT